MELWCTVGLTVGLVVGIPVLFVLLFKLFVICTTGWCRSQNRLDGKTIIVTGSNSGIGKEAAKTLADRGARVILACRNVQKANEAVDEIRAETPNCDVVVKRLDLCSLDSIRTFAQEIIAEEKKLDILVNNAGLAGGPFKLTDDGFDELYQANYLGPFYLTELLLPLLKKSAPSRIVNTGSLAYTAGRVNPDTFKHDTRNRSKPSLFRYGDTKLAMLMWTKAMGEELQGSDVTINVLHPGIVATPIAQKAPFNVSNMIFLFNIFAFGRSIKAGAQTILHLCLDDNREKVSGKYWAECVPTRVYMGNNKEKNRALLKATREILNVDQQEHTN